MSTPIGNMGDITLRAIDILKRASVLACEDTRTGMKLFNLLGLPVKNRKFISHHSHNEKQSAPGIISLILSGQSVALLSDGGTPVISDPGETLVRLCHEEGVAVHIVPGASSLTASLCLAPLSAPFIFAGFSPATPKMRRRLLKKYSITLLPIILYESPHRISDLLSDIMVIIPDSEITILREMTKINSERIKSDPKTMLGHFAQNPPKGEIVVIIEPPKTKAQESSQADLLMPL